MNELTWNLKHSYTKLPELFFTRQSPSPASDPKRVIFNQKLADELGIPMELETFAGNKLPPHSEPLAQAYAGHQFGHFTMLGDGRALLLGEQGTRRGQRVDIQLKGSGLTPYSRGGDGLAALGPMLREYVVSEAMKGLGIPTTRSLAVVTTGKVVMRERPLQGAILTRVAASHIRVGTFEYASQFGEVEDVKALADYTISRHYSEVESSDLKYLLFLREVVKKQAILISKWQLVGFIHGVMNTDNMAISGETMDYGPCAFMDTYHPATVFSSIDRGGRYAYSRQPQMAAWNLARFAETLLPFLHEEEEEAIKLAQAEVTNFGVVYQEAWISGMREKLGLLTEEPEDKTLIGDLLNLMEEYEADYTNTFRGLTLDKLEGMEFFNSHGFKKWHHRWKERLQRQGATSTQVKTLMKKHNPSIISRNHLVEEALAAAEVGDLTVMEKLLAVLADPYAYTEEQEGFVQPPGSGCGGYQTFCGT